MPIVVNLDVVMARRKMSLNELAAKVDLTLANLSILKNNHAKAVRFTTLEAICKALDCQPGDILEFVPEADERKKELPRCGPRCLLCSCSCPYCSRRCWGSKAGPAGPGRAPIWPWRSALPCACGGGRTGVAGGVSC